MPGVQGEAGGDGMTARDTSIYAKRKAGQKKKVAAPRDPREAGLVRKAQKGCIDSRNALIQMHLGWIYETTRRSIHPRQRVEEWVSYSVERFCNAIRCFRPGRGANLTTFAAYAMRHMLWRHARDDGLIHIPQRGSTNRDELYVQRARASRRVVRMGGALNGVGAENGRKELALTLEDRSAQRPWEAADHALQTAAVQQAMLELSERDRSMVLMQMQGMTLRAIGEKVGLSRERVRQLIDQSLTQIRTACGVEEAGDELGG